MNNTPLVLTIDLGTSGPKVSLFDSELRLLGSCFREVPLIFVGKNGVEQDPRLWMRRIEECILELRLKHAGAFSRIEAINTTAQWAGTIPLNAQGEPLGNAILWMDSRGAPYARELMNGWIKVDGYGLFNVLRWISITGGCPTQSGKDPISHILYLQAEQPEIYHATQSFVEPKDFLNFMLTGQLCASQDSMTVHWLTDTRRIESITYSDDLIQKSGIDPKKLPPLVPVNSVLGKIRPKLAQAWGIPKNALVIAGTPDIHSAAVGSGGVSDFIPHLYIGTSSWMVCHVPFKKTDLFHNMASIPSGIPGRYLLVNEQQTAGGCLQFLKNQVFFPKNSVLPSTVPNTLYERMDELAQSTPEGSEGLLFFPWLNGERSPLDQNHLRGGWINLSLKHEQKHLIRSVMEGVALNSRWLMEHCERFCGAPFSSLRFIGGGALSGVWSQILANTLNRPIHRIKDPLSANSRGVAALAWVALKKMTLEEISSKIEIHETILPQSQHRDLYDQNYQFFRQFHQTNEGLFKKLNSKGA
ncbi:MAG: xylulokinase [Bdellovibrionia bacterium]